jgi:hypothetical protein
MLSRRKRRRDNEGDTVSLLICAGYASHPEIFINADPS